MWPRYFVCCVILVLLHNLFLDIGVILNQSKYSWGEMFAQISNGIVFCHGEQMGGALWFVPVLLVSSSFFAGIIWASRQCLKISNSRRLSVKNICIIVLSFLFGAFGVILNLRKVELMYHIHTAFLVIPIYSGAYFLRNSCKNVDSLVRWYVAIPLTIALYYVVAQLGWRINLSKEVIIGPVQFFAVSFAGIYVCLFAAKIIQRIPILKDFFALIGRHSFEIMAFHFVVIKLVDIVYSICINESDPQVYGQFICAYSRECWFLYALFATAIPALAGDGWAHLAARLKGRLVQSGRNP